MAKDFRNDKPRPERQNREQRPERKTSRRERSTRENPHSIVKGIKRVTRIKDDEEKLLSRRPRIRMADEERGSAKRPPRRTFSDDRYPSRENRGRRNTEEGRRGRTSGRPYGEGKFQPRESRYSDSNERRGAGTRPSGRDSFEGKRFGSKESRFRNTDESRESRGRTTRKPYGEDRAQSTESRFRGPDNREGRSRTGREPVGERKFRSRKENERQPSPERKRNYKKKEEDSEEHPGLIRLNRFIANAGICSRREADQYIQSGIVTVNGKTVTELGTKVLRTDEVAFDGKKLIAEKKVYLLLNKPKNYITTTDDPHAEKTVMELVAGACPEHIYPVGRLDRNSTGLLLFTNDGEMAKRLSHPSHLNKKIYQVTLDKPLTKKDLEQIASGVELEDGLIAADEINYIDAEDKTEIGIEIHSGKNRIVRRIFENLGYTVKKLDRVYYAGLTKKNLPRGKWRFLSPQEVNFLMMK
jgi:23S rRNA pseudouridine2605 synthase